MALLQFGDIVSSSGFYGRDGIVYADMAEAEFHFSGFDGYNNIGFRMGDSLGWIGVGFCAACFTFAVVEYRYAINQSSVTMGNERFVDNSDDELIGSSGIDNPDINFRIIVQRATSE